MSWLSEPGVEHVIANTITCKHCGYKTACYGGLVPMYCGVCGVHRIVGERQDGTRPESKLVTRLP